MNETNGVVEVNLPEDTYLCTIFHVKLETGMLTFAKGRKPKSPRETLEEKVEHHRNA